MRVLITGGATGLGQAIALKWAEKWAGKDEGVDIWIADMKQESSDEASIFKTMEIKSRYNISSQRN